MNPEIYKGVPVPDGLWPNGYTSEASWWMRGVRSAVNIVRPLLDALTGGEACTPEDNGWCGTHKADKLGEVCAVTAAREFLEASAPEAVWRSTTVIDPYLYWCLDHRPALAVTRVELKNIHPSVEIQCVQCGRAAR